MLFALWHLYTFNEKLLTIKSNIIIKVLPVMYAIGFYFKCKIKSSWMISARAIRIFRGIMIVKLKHKCPQKPLILPAAFAYVLYM